MRRISSILFRLQRILLLTTIVAAFAGCYNQKPSAVGSSKRNTSSSVADNKHIRCYSRNYNFVVKADSMPIIRQQPEEILNHMLTDTVFVHKNNHLVVADIRILPNDSIDSVWVQLARDQDTFGWIHEGALLKSVMPNDPISQFISTFSDTHLLVFLLIIGVISIGYSLRIMLRKRAYIVHFNDMDSVYPTLLAIAVAVAATFYSSIQMFAPGEWRHFYFHPSLNPFSLPVVLGIFVSAVWGMLILSLAMVDDVKRQLPFSQAVLYLCGTAAICAANYIIFSIATLYYVGYVLLVVYVVYSFRQYKKVARTCLYTCGNCGSKLRRKGKCPHCGAINA